MSSFTEEQLLAEFVRRYEQSARQRAVIPSLEALLCEERFFGLVTATPLQRALCRVIEGAPLVELAFDPTVIAAFNGVLPMVNPLEVLILSGVRTAKTLIAAAVAVWCSQKVEIPSFVRHGEIPRFSVLSLKKDNATVCFTHLQAAMRRPALADLVITNAPSEWKEIIDETKGDSPVGIFFLWHPSGIPIEIRIVAGERAGGSLVSRWSAGAVFDEAPRMVGSAEGVVNYDDCRNAVISRLLPGAKLLSIGSPWQPYGPVYDIVMNEWGIPTAERVVMKAPGAAMNPFWWTAERIAKMRADPKQAVAYKTDALAEFADAEEQLIPAGALQKCIRPAPAVLLPEPRCTYRAAMDPATRVNAWTLVIGTMQSGIKRIAVAKQWQGSADVPLRPSTVLKEARDLLAQYGIHEVDTDQFAADALIDLGANIGLTIISVDWLQGNRNEPYLSLAAQIQEGKYDLPNDPDLRKDLIMLKKAPSSRGVSIRLPKTTDGRHCDYAAALALLEKRYLEEQKAVLPASGSPEAEQQLEAKTELEELEAIIHPKEWWDKEDPYAES